MLSAALRLVRDLCTSQRWFPYWAVGVWLADAALTGLIVRRIPFTNVDFEAYAMQVDAVAGGVFDYMQLRGPTGPIAYPAGFVWFFLPFRVLHCSVLQMQVVFAALYLGTLACVFEVYRKAGAPGWLLLLCMLSKRVHSIYVLRLFNDGVAELLFYAALVLLLHKRTWSCALMFSAAVSIKIHPLLCCPALGVCWILRHGWRKTLQLIGCAAVWQIAVAAPFLWKNPAGYVSRAFGGPGDLQHAWSVNWRFLGEEVFLHRLFAPALLACHAAVGLWFAHMRWVPGGLLDPRIWRWSSSAALDARGVVCLVFGCNFVGVAFLRTLHFQYLVWYFHTVPFLAWYAWQPESRQGLAWVLSCLGVAVLTLAVEVPYLLTTRGVVRGPDGRTWTTDGVPTAYGSVALQITHILILALLARRPVQLLSERDGKRD